MPGKKGKQNSKAVEAKIRKETTKANKNEALTKQAQDAAWSDQGNTTKEKRKQEQERKKADDAKKRAAKKALEAEDAALMEKSKVKVKAQKPTAAVLQAKREREDAERAKQRAEAEMAKKKIVDQMDLLENANHATAADEQWTGDIEHAIKDLSVTSGGDKNPEKRRAAAYKKFAEITIPVLKDEFPNLKHSQIKQKCWDLWQKSPSNPANMR